MVIYVTGDTHGNNSGKKLFQRHIVKNCNKLIITGDFGFVWYYPSNTTLYKKQQKELDTLQTLPYEILFVDGNHENFNVLKTFPIELRYNGNVRKIRNNIFQLLRGEIYDIDGNKIFTMGGGYSVDKRLRTVNETWWKEEEPSVEEMTYAFENLKKHYNTVDFIITHSLPYGKKQIAFGLREKYYGKKIDYIYEPSDTEIFLDKIHNVVKFHSWYSGHYHYDDIIYSTNSKRFYYNLYDEFVELKKFSIEGLRENYKCPILYEY